MSHAAEKTCGGTVGNMRCAGEDMVGRRAAKRGVSILRCELVAPAGRTPNGNQSRREPNRAGESRRAGGPGAG